MNVQAAMDRVINGTPDESQTELADAMNLAANVIGAYALRWKMEKSFIPDMAIVVEDSARNYVVLNK